MPSDGDDPPRRGGEVPHRSGMASDASASAAPRFLHGLPVITEIAPGDILTFQVQIEAGVFRVSWLHCGEIIHNSSRRHVKAHPNGW
ncbi:hypothetical protein BIW11_04229 [Tropilaelaps mercedesae]|uniref:Uncharacterized protein n=1 Tax=Tropilaelaps mercedesae TaxID=418985 RepID=A0A1V9X955_9ACAR|nr:hypothetical protein BIW11_04229 [Tropilaelaps mercedesae]